MSAHGKDKEHPVTDGVLIFPLTQQEVDWESYILNRKDMTGVSPIEGLDTASIDLKNGAAFLSSLEPLISPYEAMKNKQNQRHCFLSFGTNLSHEDLSTIALRSDISIYEDHPFSILSGTLNEWREAVVSFCIKERSITVRYAFNVVLIFLERSGFRHVFHEYDKDTITDETFILCRNKNSS